MDRRTFLKSASMKGTAIVTASAVGTEMLHAAESIGASDVPVLYPRLRRHR